MEVITRKTTVGEFALADFRTTEIFEKYGVDYRFEGRKSLETLATEKGWDAVKLQNELEALLQKPRMENTDFDTWPLDLVMDYLVKKHHRQVTQSAPVIRFYMDKVCRVHGENHSELFKIRALAFASCEALIAGHKKEEKELYPLIEELFWTKERDGVLSPDFKMDTLEESLEAVFHGLQAESKRHEKIRELSNNYTNPPDGCTSYRLGLTHLREFKEALDAETHLKNNLLFYKTNRLIGYYKIHVK